MNEDRLLAQKGTMVPTRDRYRLVDIVLVLIPRSAKGIDKCCVRYLRIDKLHHGLLQIIEIDSVLGWSPCDNVVFIIIVSSQRCKFLSIRELDVDTVFLHDPLDTAPTHADDALVISLWDVERDLRRKLLLQQGEPLKYGAIVASEIDEEIVVIERLKLNLHVRCLHDLVDLAIFLAADKFTVLIGQLDLETDLVVERLRTIRPSIASAPASLTLIISSSRIMLTAARTSCSKPCISKHMLLKTTSAPVIDDICLVMAVT